MNRRSFLLHTAAYLLGGYLGTGVFSRAFAAAPAAGGRIAVIIDDIGYSFSRTRSFLDLGVPITFAVLPRLPKTADIAYEICRQGHEIMLHQPMEPWSRDYDPGPGALFVGDGPDKIQRTVEANIVNVPYATGVNNHMGSRFTASPREIRQTLGTIQANGLFFVDSYTSGRSKAYETACHLHMPAACRNIFLDTARSESAVLYQLLKLKRHARCHGQAVGIGHPFPETARALRRFIQNHHDDTTSLVYVSQILPG